tara:strand:+ start:805 stop:1488 length:684 start_codon:yes stop_codon:yes gene_type:complete
MTVELIDYMGSDLTVVNAARVSFDKQSDWEEIPFGGHASAHRLPNSLSKKDKDLIIYLAKHNHWTPFGHCSAQFRVTAPVFVARQLVKHQVGLVWNETSRRYVNNSPEFWKPTVWRASADNKKQGSSSTGVSSQDIIEHVYDDTVRHARDSYNYLLNFGVCPEQARSLLPQSMITQWYWSGTLAAFSRVYKLRSKEDAQQETRIIAEEINNHMIKLFPKSWEALCGN